MNFKVFISHSSAQDKFASQVADYIGRDKVHLDIHNFEKGSENDSTFPFYDAHTTTYSVRDGSDWESTLKPRLHQRLSNSKNIILFLSSNTKHSRALNEEMDYGIGVLKLPVIVVYPEYTDKTDVAENGRIKRHLRMLWDNLPRFRDQMDDVPTIHVPLSKILISKALRDPDLTVQHKNENGRWFY